jgi:hypothetical protein
MGQRLDEFRAAAADCVEAARKTPDPVAAGSIDRFQPPANVRQFRPVNRGCAGRYREEAAADLERLGGLLSLTADDASRVSGLVA